MFYGKSELPLTTEDEMVALTPRERGAIYDFVVQKARQENKMVSLEQDTLLTANLEELVKKKGLGKDKGQTGE